MANAYVRFAAENRPLFGVLFDVGLDKNRRYPELRDAYEGVERRVRRLRCRALPG